MSFAGTPSFAEQGGLASCVVQTLKELRADPVAALSRTAQGAAQALGRYRNSVRSEIQTDGWWRLPLTRNNSPKVFNTGNVFANPILGGIQESVNLIWKARYGESAPLRIRAPFLQASGAIAWGGLLAGVDQSMHQSFEKNYVENDTLGANYLAEAGNLGLVSSSSYLGFVYDPLFLKNGLQDFQSSFQNWYKEGKPLPRYSEFTEAGVLKNQEEAQALDRIARSIVDDYFRLGLNRRRSKDQNLETYFQSELAKRALADPILKGKSEADLQVMRLLFEPSIRINGKADSLLYSRILHENGGSIPSAYGALAQETQYRVHPLDLIMMSQASEKDADAIQRKVSHLMQLTGAKGDHLAEAWRSDLPVFKTGISIETPQKTAGATHSEEDLLSLMSTDSRFSAIAQAFKNGNLSYNQALLSMRAELASYNDLYLRQRASPSKSTQVTISDNSEQTIQLPQAKPKDLCELRGAKNRETNPLFAQVNIIASMPIRQSLLGCLGDSSAESEEIDSCAQTLAAKEMNLDSQNICKKLLKSAEATSCIQKALALKTTVSQCAYLMSSEIWNNHYLGARTLASQPGATAAFDDTIQKTLSTDLEVCTDPALINEYSKSDPNLAHSSCD